jgi:hypothetical protein
MMPCLICGKLSRASKCEQHAAEEKARRNNRLESVNRLQKKRAKYNADYQRRAKQVREQARLNPTKCHLCGEWFKEGDTIQADHLYPEMNNESPLMPAHARCNASRGNKPLAQ